MQFLGDFCAKLGYNCVSGTCLEHCHETAVKCVLFDAMENVTVHKELFILQVINSID